MLESEEHKAARIAQRRAPKVPREKKPMTKVQIGIMLAILGALALAVVVGGALQKQDSDGTSLGALDACEAQVSSVITGASFGFSGVKATLQDSGEWWVRGKAGERNFTCFLTYQDGEYAGDAPLID